MHPKARAVATAIAVLVLVGAAPTPAIGVVQPAQKRRVYVAPPPPPPPPAPAPITVAAVGDMSFSSAPGRLVASSGPRAPFAYVAASLRDADVTVGNLEGALSSRGTAVPGKTFTFRGSPRVIEGLKWSGFDLLALGNNHARDYGAVALMDTVANLNRASIGHAGAGANRAAAWTPAIITRNGAKIAFLSFSQIGPSNFSATSAQPGTAFTLSASQVRAAVAQAHAKADYVVVSFHWGVERQYAPTSAQVRFGRLAIDSGADLVLSHHPHVIEGVEYYRGKLIAYSLGNFVFSPGSAEGHDTMILRVSVGPKGVLSANATPCVIDATGRPRPATGASARRILGIIGRTSRARGTGVWTENGVAYFKP